MLTLTMVFHGLIFTQDEVISFRLDSDEKKNEK